MMKSKYTAIQLIRLIESSDQVYVNTNSLVGYVKVVKGDLVYKLRESGATRKNLFFPAELTKNKLYLSW